MEHDVVNVSVEQRGCELFGVVVGHVLRSIDSYKSHEIAFHPLGQHFVFDVEVSSASGWLLGVSLSS